MRAVSPGVHACHTAPVRARSAPRSGAHSCVPPRMHACSGAQPCMPPRSHRIYRSDLRGHAVAEAAVAVPRAWTALGHREVRKKVPVGPLSSSENSTQRGRKTSSRQWIEWMPCRGGHDGHLADLEALRHIVHGPSEPFTDAPHLWPKGCLGWKKSTMIDVGVSGSIIFKSP